jgi:hypothetical protein
MADGSDHVLADAKGYEGVILQENIFPLADGIDRLLKPAIAKGKPYFPQI